MTQPPFVELRSLSKEFSGVKVLDDVSMSFRLGEVHALLGENGAGKSTFIKILTGVYTQTSGDIVIDGKPANIRTPPDARRYGLGAVYQDVELVSRFTVAENIILGHEAGTDRAAAAGDPQGRRRDLSRTSASRSIPTAAPHRSRRPRPRSSP